MRVIKAANSKIARLWGKGKVQPDSYRLLTYVIGEPVGPQCFPVPENPGEPGKSSKSAGGGMSLHSVATSKSCDSNKFDNPVEPGAFGKPSKFSEPDKPIESGDYSESSKPAGSGMLLHSVATSKSCDSSTFDNPVEPGGFGELNGYNVTDKSAGSGMLLHNAVTGELLLLDAEEAAQLNELPATYSPWMDSLIEQHFLVRENADDQKTVETLRRTLRMLEAKHQITGYTILPTTECNARCFYCYECNVARETMTDETATRLVEFMDAHRDGQPLRIGWFGGEPLLGVRQIDYICHELERRGVPFTSSMISNGYLFDAELAERAAKVWNLKQIQITLDGTEGVYNKTKAYLHAPGSPYQKVLDNIGHLMEQGIDVSIRLNLGFHNAEDLSALIDELAARFDDKTHLGAYTHLLFDDCGLEPKRFSEEELRHLYAHKRALDAQLRQYATAGDKHTLNDQAQSKENALADWGVSEGNAPSGEAAGEGRTQGSQATGEGHASGGRAESKGAALSGWESGEGHASGSQVGSNSQVADEGYEPGSQVAAADLAHCEKHIAACDTRKLPLLKTYRCMADNPSSVVVLPSGALGKCEHCTDTHFVGSLDEGITNKQELELFAERMVYSPCATCALYPACIKLKLCEPDRACAPELARVRIDDTRSTMRSHYEQWISEGGKNPSESGESPNATPAELDEEFAGGFGNTIRC